MCGGVHDGLHNVAPHRNRYIVLHVVSSALLRVVETDATAGLRRLDNGVVPGEGDRNGTRRFTVQGQGLGVDVELFCPLLEPTAAPLRAVRPITELGFA